MNKTLIVIALMLQASVSFGESRFGRPVVKVVKSDTYKYVKSDDVKYPTLSNDQTVVSCLVYRGTVHYYIEVNVTNKTDGDLYVRPGFVHIEKPGYMLYQVDTIKAAEEAAAAGGIQFRPTPAPYIPPTYNTTTNATATTYGNQTSIAGTSTTTANYSGQAGANFGNAIGNAIAARQFYKAQRTEIAFSNFLAAHSQSGSDIMIPAGQTRTFVEVYDQAKAKKKPFVVDLTVGSEKFYFAYKE